MADIKAIENVASLESHYAWVLQRMPPAEQLRDKTIASLSAVIDMVKNEHNKWAVKQFGFDEDMNLFGFEDEVRTQGKRYSSIDA